MLQDLHGDLLISGLHMIAFNNRKDKVNLAHVCIMVDEGSLAPGKTS